MANQEHLDMLLQEVDKWNEWREQNPDVRPDLRGANLRRVNLSRADLTEADLTEADLRQANLIIANLTGAWLLQANLLEAHLHEAKLLEAHLHEAKLLGAILTQTNLGKADLTWSTLAGADLIESNLYETNLIGANLRNTNLTGANLSKADLSKANLEGANLYNANLNGTDLSGAFLGRTVFAEVDLSSTKGLVEINYAGPSVIDLYTVKLPQDGSAIHFLRGVGVPDEWIDFYRAQMMSPIQYHSCFISYAHEDELFAQRLHADLQAQGIRCWFAPKDLKIGDYYRQEIDQAIYVHEKLLTILSQHSIESEWVEDEVQQAEEKEGRILRTVLFPVRVDEAIMQSTRSWAKSLRYHRHIGDFTNWTHPQAYQDAFERLLRDLKKADDPQKT